MAANGFPSYWSIVSLKDTGNARFSYGSLHTGIINFAFADGSGYSVRIRVRAVTRGVVLGMGTPSLARPNSHSDCVHSSAAFRASAWVSRADGRSC